MKLLYHLKKDFYGEFTLEDAINDSRRNQRGMCQSTDRYAKANNKCMKNYDKTIESLYLTYLDANNFYEWAMSQKEPVNGFMWCNKYLSDFNEDFIKNYDENSDEGYFLEVDVEYLKQLFSSHKELPFLPERRKLEKVEKLVCSIEDRKICHSHKSFKTSIK